MIFDLGIVVPSIRTHLWEQLYNSIEKSCVGRYTWVLYLVSPFMRDAPGKHVRMFKSHRSPTACAQFVVDCEVNTRLMYHTTDDAILRENALDTCLDYYFSLKNPFSIIMNMRYREGANHNSKEFPPHYWKAGTWPDNRLPGVNPNWGISLQPMMFTSTFKYYGGWDCMFDYLVYANHDLLFRMQQDGCRVVDSPVEVVSADWMEGMTGDHKPIHIAQTEHDLPLYQKIYSDPRAAEKRKRIPSENWTKTPMIWETRFDKNNPEKNYGELKLL